MNLKSKITWINILSTVVLILSAVQPQFPEYAKWLALAVSVLTIVLRQLQGKEVKLGSRTVKL